MEEQAALYNFHQHFSRKKCVCFNRRNLNVVYAIKKPQATIWSLVSTSFNFIKKMTSLLFTINQFLAWKFKFFTSSIFYAKAVDCLFHARALIWRGALIFFVVSVKIGNKKALLPRPFGPRSFRFSKFCNKWHNFLPVNELAFPISFSISGTPFLGNFFARFLFVWQEHLASTQKNKKWNFFSPCRIY